MTGEPAGIALALAGVFAVGIAGSAMADTPSVTWTQYSISRLRGYEPALQELAPVADDIQQRPRHDEAIVLSREMRPARARSCEPNTVSAQRLPSPFDIGTHHCRHQPHGPWLLEIYQARTAEMPDLVSRNLRQIGS